VAGVDAAHRRRRRSCGERTGHRPSPGGSDRRIRESRLIMAVRAGDALTAALRDDIDRLLTAEPEVRRDAADSVHQMRVATRRLRSILRSYTGLLDPGATNEVRTELAWLAGVL